MIPSHFNTINFLICVTKLDQDVLPSYIMARNDVQYLTRNWGAYRDRIDVRRILILVWIRFNKLYFLANRNPQSNIKV